ncbi:MAG: ABC transporter permease [Chloroflexota bacterium]
MVAVLVAVSILSIFWTPHDPTHVSVLKRFEGFGQNGHLMGTDQLGRDVLSMLMAGTRDTLIVGIGTVLLALVIGAPLGALAAMQRGWVGMLVMRLSDLLLAFPALLLAILFAAVFRPSTATAIFAVGIAFIPVFARVVRGAGLQVMEQEYVSASRTFGGSGPWIFWRHLLPNIVPLIVVQTTVAFATAILAAASLSYLGLGTPPPTPSWGRMLSESQSYLSQSPTLALWPGVSIALSVLGFSLLGDGLRELLDPKMAAGLDSKPGRG